MPSAIDTLFFDIGGVLVDINFTSLHRGLAADCPGLNSASMDDTALNRFFSQYYSNSDKSLGLSTIHIRPDVNLEKELTLLGVPL